MLPLLVSESTGGLTDEKADILTKRLSKMTT